MTTFDTLTQQREADIGAQEGRAAQRQGTLDQSIAATGVAREKELAPLEAKASEQLAGLEGLQPPKPTELPEYKPKPIVDAQDYQKLSWGLIGLAAIGGAVSKGNWLGVSSSLNGALKGYLEGNQERAKKDYEDYQRKFEAAKARDAQAQKEFEDILRSRTLTINSMLQQVKLAASKYDRQDIRAAAEQKSIDAIWRQVEASRNSLTQIEARHDQVVTQMDAQMERLKFQMGGSAGGLTDKGRDFLERMVESGSYDLMRAASSRYGAAKVVPIINDMAEKGVDPGEVTAAKIELAAKSSALRVTEVRQAGVERLTGTVQRMQQKVLELAQRVVPTGSPPVNAKLYAIKQAMGDKDFAKLRTEVAAIARQYMEAVTMPGSNAQLHAGSQELADQILNINSSVGQFVGAFEGMNEEIQSGGESLSATAKRLHAAIAGQGLQFAGAEQVGRSWEEKGGNPTSAGSPQSKVMRFDAQGNPLP
jgi:hypothetical protein